MILTHIDMYKSCKYGNKSPVQRVRRRVSFTIPLRLLCDGHAVGTMDTSDRAA